MTAAGYRAELIDWVRRTTTAQGVPEHVPVEVFQTRLAALFGRTASALPDARIERGRSDQRTSAPTA